MHCKVQKIKNKNKNNLLIFKCMYLKHPFNSMLLSCFFHTLSLWKAPTYAPSHIKIITAVANLLSQYRKLTSNMKYTATTCGSYALPPAEHNTFSVRGISTAISGARRLRNIRAVKSNWKIFPMSFTEIYHEIWKGLEECNEEKSAVLMVIL